MGIGCEFHYQISADRSVEMGWRRPTAEDGVMAGDSCKEERLVW